MGHQSALTISAARHAAGICAFICLCSSAASSRFTMALSDGGTFNLHLLILLWISYHGEG